MHIALFIKVIYWIQILLKKKIFYCFSYKATFSMSKVNFWFSILLKQKVWTSMYLRTKIKINLSIFGSSREKKKSLLLIRCYK